MAIINSKRNVESLAEDATLYGPRWSLIDESYDIPGIVPVGE